MTFICIMVNYVMKVRLHTENVTIDTLHGKLRDESETSH